MTTLIGRAFTFVAASLLLTTIAVRARATETTSDLVQASLVADAATIAPGSAFTLAVRMKIAPHWHTYWINPGESGEPTKIKWSGPKGLTFGDIRWPTPHKIIMDGAITYGYENEVLLMVPVTASKELAASGDATIEADVSWLSCKEVCIEGGAKLSIKLPVGEKKTSANEALFAAWKKRTPVNVDSPAAAMVAKMEQPVGPDGQPLPTLSINWKKTPKKVEWYPAATAAIAIEDVKVNHQADKTVVGFAPTVFQPEEAAGGVVGGVLVFENEAGERVGVNAPVKVPMKAIDSK